MVRTVGVADYVVTALVPELPIKEDTKVCSERARQILEESARLGETLNGDE